VLKSIDLVQGRAKCQSLYLGRQPTCAGRLGNQPAGGLW
jgi:hypothetical protein